MAETVSRNETNLTGREISRKIQFYGISIKVSAKKGKNNYVQLTSDEILQLFNKIKELSKKLPKEITREVLLNKVPNDILEKAFGNNIPEVIKLEDITNIEVERELLRDSAFIPLLAPIIETRIVAITESPQSRKIVSSIFYSRMEEAYRKFQEERLLNHA